MKRCAGCWVLAATLSGCLATERPPQQMTCGGGLDGAHAANVPGVMGPWGQPVAMTAPYAMAAPSDSMARMMMSHSMPLDMAPMGPNGSNIVQAQALAMAGGPSGVVTAGGPSCPPGMPGGLGMPGMPGGPGMPGAGIPGLPGGMMPGMMPPAGAVAAVGALPSGVPSQFPTHRTSVRFREPTGMRVSWLTSTPDGKGNYANHLTVPGRYNFVQAAIYRLKLSNIPNRPGLELYPTLEVVPSNAKTDTFLAHSAVPVAFTDEDFDQVAAGNYIVKVVYLPFPQFQDLATTGPDEVVSSRLEPGADPIAEACRRGNILLVLRLGNIDLEAPNTPPMNAPGAYPMKNAMPPMMAPGMGPGTGGPGMMVPYGFMNQGRPLMMGPKGPIMPLPGTETMSPGDPSSTKGANMQPTGPMSKATMRPAVQPAKAETVASSTADEDAPPPPPKKPWWKRHLFESEPQSNR